MDRRTMLVASVAGGAGLSLLSGSVSAKPRRARTDDSPESKAAVAGGVAYFSSRCDAQLALCQALENAIKSGDLAASRHAYVESRPPYEEIETLAYAFEDTDRDIDARPYAFEAGETSEDFRGFHRIEVLLFGHDDVEAALPYAQELTRSVQTLKGQLSELDRFDAAGQFGGMLALSNEVAAKKISSEEEAWSDQSLLIFKHNWIGALSQFKPFAPMVARTNRSAVDQVIAAHQAAQDTLKPYFREGVVAATPYSRVSMAERRKMADASNRFRDSLSNAGVAIGLDVEIQ